MVKMLINLIKVLLFGKNPRWVARATGTILMLLEKGHISQTH
jgi:hypothetical protein